MAVVERLCSRASPSLSEAIHQYQCVSEASGWAHVVTSLVFFFIFSCTINGLMDCIEASKRSFCSIGALYLPVLSSTTMLPSARTVASSSCCTSSSSESIASDVSHLAGSQNRAAYLQLREFGIRRVG
jgi:hypothetical protein